MSKRIILLIATSILILALSMTMTIALPYTSSIYIANQSVTLRVSPNSTSKQAASVKKGDFVEYKGKSGSYAKVSYKGTVGYGTLSSFTKLNAKTKYVKPQVTCVYADTATNSKKLYEVYYNEMLRSYCEIGSWTMVATADNKVGYILTKDLAMLKTTPNEKLKKQQSVIVKEANLYHYPTVSKGIKTKIAIGIDVTTYETVGMYTRVVSDGYEGYIATLNLRQDTLTTKYVSSATANVRSTPDTLDSNITDKIYYREKLSCYGEFNSYTRVKTDGKYSYVLTSNLTEALNTYHSIPKIVMRPTVNVMESPSSETEKLGTLTMNTQVTAYETIGAYTRIAYAGGFAYVVTASLDDDFVTQDRYINAVSANVYAVASINGTVIKQAYYREVVKTLETEGDFTKIMTETGFAYIPADVLSEALPSADGKQSYIKQEKTGVLKYPVNGSAVLGTLGLNAPVVIYETIGNYVRIEYNGSDAYISADSLMSNRNYMIANSAAANVRNGASGDANVIGKIYYRQSFLTYGQTGAYTKIDFNGTPGYVLTADLSTEIEDIYRGYVYVIQASAKLCSLPSGDGEVVDTVPYCTILDAYEEIAGYTRVLYNNKFCYISTRNIIDQIEDILICQKEICTETAYLRVAPNNDAEVAYKIKYLDQVGYIDMVGSTWARVSYKNEIFFISINRLRDVETRPAFAAPNSTIERIYYTGISFLGTPYLLGAERGDTSSFDCSSFMGYLFETVAGIDLPRLSRQQAESELGTVVSLSNIQPGDVIYFDMSSGYIDHTALYIGNGEILHATSITGMVCIAPLDEKRLDALVLVKRYV